MHTLVEKLADFLADYNVDMYDDASLGGEKYRIDCVIIENHVGSLKARMRLLKAFNAFNTFPDSPEGVTVVQTGPIVMNERAEDEYDFSVNIEFKKTDERLKREAKIVPTDELPFTEETFDDSITANVKTGRQASEYGGHDVYEDYEEVEDFEITSDISGKGIDVDGGYRLPDGRDVTIEEAIAVYQEDYHQRPVKTDEGIMLTDDLNEEVGGDPYTMDEFRREFADFASNADYIPLDEGHVMKFWEETR